MAGAYSHPVPRDQHVACRKVDKRVLSARMIRAAQGNRRLWCAARGSAAAAMKRAKDGSRVGNGPCMTLLCPGYLVASV